MTGTRKGYWPQEASFCILVGIYCHNIPAHTPRSGYHGVTEVAKTANIAKMAEKCINCRTARPTPPHTNPMELGPENICLAQNRKNLKDSWFSTPKKVAVIFSSPLHPPPPHPPLMTAQNRGFQVGGVWGGPDQKLIGGCVYWTK